MISPGARILVAMSGGVDSAVAAALLTEQGYDCVGVTLRLVPEPEGTTVFEPCCGREAAEDARRVCETLGLPHEVVHAVERFDRDIIAYYLKEYCAGRTPNPCVRCNRMIKFGALYRHADRLGAQYVAMGHYVRLETRGHRLALRRAVHREKDQSYVLAPLTQRQLRRALFPLGAWRKEEVRARARLLGLHTARKAESQETCFVPDRHYGRFVEERSGPVLPGPIVSTGGVVLGQHRGLLHYTVGQRRGLGIGAARPLYVIALDTERNTLVVGHAEETYCERFTTGPLCWGGLRRQAAPFDASVQLRSHHQPGPATVIPGRHGATVLLHTAQRSVTPGQWAVFYDADGYVLASAIIQNFTRATPPASTDRAGGPS